MAAGSSVISVPKTYSSLDYVHLTREDFKKKSVDDKLVIVFDEIRFTREEQVSGFKRFEQSVAHVSEALTKVTDTTNAQTELLKTLAYKSIDLEARSRRNNLIFRGFHENPGENCFQIIRDFLGDRLDLDPGVMYIARAHRLGSRYSGGHNRPRPIIVNFRDYCDVEEIMGRVYMLKNTPFAVDLDLPKEIQTARRELWPKFKERKANNPRASVKIVYPAKLLVNGRVVENALPEWDKYVHNNRLPSLPKIQTETTNNADSVSTADKAERAESALFVTRGEASRNLSDTQRIGGSRSTVTVGVAQSSNSTTDNSARTVLTCEKTNDRTEMFDNSQTSAKSVYTATPPSTPSSDPGERRKGHVSRSVQKSVRRESSPSPYPRQQRCNSNSRHQKVSNSQTTILRSQVEKVRHRGKSPDVITDTGLDDVTFLLNPDGKQ